MKSTLIVCIILLFGSKLNAQINLILNPSFEDHSLCPGGYDAAKYCNYWSSLDSLWSPPDWAHDLSGVPEYCNVCATSSQVSIPMGSYYFHNTRSGNGMMQMQMFYDKSDTGYARDYLQGHLSKTLIAGHTYRVNFYVVNEYMSFAINHIGAYFDDGTIDTTRHPDYVQSQYTPQIVENDLLSDTLNWTPISGTFVAEGTERLITIGQFTDLNHTNSSLLFDTSLCHGRCNIYCHFLIDDVSVIDCDNVPYYVRDTFINLGDSAPLGPTERLLPYTWYQLGNPTPFDSGSGVIVRPTVTTTYILKQDLCGKILYDTTTVHVWPDTVRHTDVPIWQFDNLTISPNPVVSVLNITGAAGCSVLVYNMLGELVLQKEIPDNYRSQHESVDMGGLLPGVYSVVVVDRVSGNRVVRMVRKE